MLKILSPIFALFLTLLIPVKSSFAVTHIDTLRTRFAATKKPTIRVRISKSMDEVLVSGTDLKRHLYPTNEEKSFSGRKSIKFNCQSFTKNNHRSVLLSKPLMLASLISPTGLVSVAGAKYNGKLHILTSPDGDSCDVVNETGIEEYISSLLPKEMNAQWPIEALKAQAVAARTYALFKIQTQQVSKTNGFNTFYDLESSEKHQVSGSFFDTTKKTDLAADETKGEVLLGPSGHLVPTFFHAKCGGQTLRPEQVWQNKVEGYEGVKCKFCSGKGTTPWKNAVDMKRMKKFLTWARDSGQLKISEQNLAKSVNVMKDQLFHRTVRIYLGDFPVLVSKSLLRRYFGRVVTPGGNFTLTKVKDYFLFGGEGLGHAVGMCQIGALYMAKQGHTYKEILAHYFPELSLNRLY